MFWCQGAHSIGLSNHKLRFVLTCSRIQRAQHSTCYQPATASYPHQGRYILALIRPSVCCMFVSRITSRLTNDLLLMIIKDNKILTNNMRVILAACRLLDVFRISLSSDVDTELRGFSSWLAGDGLKSSLRYVIGLRTYKYSLPEDQCGHPTIFRIRCLWRHQVHIAYRTTNKIYSKK